MSNEAPKCIRCGEPVEVNREQYGLYERMHWLCFHLEFEHSGDADAPCSDVSCPIWHLEVYRSALRETGSDPDTVLRAAITRRFG